MALNGHRGVSLVELMVAMVVFGVAMAAAVSGILPVMQGAKQQSKIAETGLEKNIGLDLLRMDLEQAGFGLPWSVSRPDPPAAAAFKYNEAGAAPASAYNDPDPLLPGGEHVLPRGLVFGDDVGGVVPDSGLNGSDYIAVKGATVSLAAEAQTWTYITVASPSAMGPGGIEVGEWGPLDLWNSQDVDVPATTQVIVLQPEYYGGRKMMLLENPGFGWSTVFGGAGAGVIANFSPSEENETYLIFGIADTGGAQLRMPFNRVDYFISTANLPARCAPGTGVLMKALIRQADGVRSDQGGGGIPLLDCVADFQVVLGWDMDQDGVIGTYSNLGPTAAVAAPRDDDGLPPLLGGPGTGSIQEALADPKFLRERLREVRVYVLAHEGQRDVYYEYRNPPASGLADNLIRVGEFGLGHDAPGGEFDLQARAGAQYNRFRWKVYTLIVRPENLMWQRL